MGIVFIKCAWRDNRHEIHAWKTHPSGARSGVQIAVLHCIDKAKRCIAH